MFEIVKFTRSDEEKVLDLWRYVCLEEHNFTEWEDYLNETHYEEYIGFWVAKIEDKIIGTIAISEGEDGSVELKRLYTDPEARGIGTAKALLDTIIDFVKENNFKKICLETYERFGRAVNFYNKNGFIETQRIDEKIFFEKEII